MNRITREELKSYLNKEFHRPEISTFDDDDFIPSLLLVIANKLDALIELAKEKKGSGN